MNEHESYDECVVANYGSVSDAGRAVHILEQASLPPDRISLVTAHVNEQSVTAKELKLDDDSLHDAAIGAGLGGVLGTLAGVAAMAVSGLGTVFLVGPLGGALFGGTVGAFLGTFAGWGVHQDQIQYYEDCVRRGQSLVVVHGDPLELARAHRVLKETDPMELHAYAKTSSESPEVYSEERIR